MMTVQSSGSICSASVVESTTSTKSAVTGFRSPVSRAARILLMSGAGAAAISRAWASASPVPASESAWPQLAQNRASGATAASQRGQVRDGDSTVMGWPS